MAYTPKEVAAIEARQPLNWEIANELASELGKSPQSIVSKALSLEFEYNRKEAPAKRETPLTKAQLVEQIEEATGLTLSGLEKATVKSLTALVGFVS